MRRQEQVAARLEQIGKPFEKLLLIRNVRQHFEAHDDVIGHRCEFQLGEIARNKLYVWPARPRGGQHLVGNVCSGHIAVLGKSWTEPALAAAGLENLEIASAQFNEPVLDDSGLAVRDFSQIVLAIFGVPLVPEGALQFFFGFHAGRLPADQGEGNATL